VRRTVEQEEVPHLVEVDLLVEVLPELLERRRLRSPSSMFTASENWARTPPAALQVEPDPSSLCSTRTTPRTPDRARWYAELRPMMPPPMTTTDADLGKS
jgi:hypothetical protein